MSWRSDCELLNRTLKERLFISNAPVAVRLVSPQEEAQAPQWLRELRKPGEGLPAKMLICQAMAMVRLYGWQVLVTPDSCECPTGLLTMGWVDMSPEYLRGEIPVSPFNQSPQARGRRMEAVTCMPAGTVAALAAAPLGDCPFEPQVVVIYCTPGQAMRLVQSTLFQEGGVIESSSAGAQGCSQYLSRVILSGQPRYILPGNGDRIFGHVEDHQMAFSLPMSHVGSLAQNIEQSHVGGQSYPVPGYLRAELRVPKAYFKASEHLRQYTAGKAE